MEGLKGRVGFVAIGAYGGNQGELFYKAGYRKRRLYAGGIQEIIWKMSTDA